MLYERKFEGGPDFCVFVGRLIGFRYDDEKKETLIIVVSENKRRYIYYNGEKGQALKKVCEKIPVIYDDETGKARPLNEPITVSGLTNDGVAFRGRDFILFSGSFTDEFMKTPKGVPLHVFAGSVASNIKSGTKAENSSEGAQIVPYHAFSMRVYRNKEKVWYTFNFWGQYALDARNVVTPGAWAAVIGCPKENETGHYARCSKVVCA